MSATALILWLYAADVFGSISLLCFVGFALTFLGAGLTMLIKAGFDPMPWAQLKKAGWLCFAFAVVGALTPSKSTAYAAAAVYVGAEVAGTEEFGLVRKLVTQELLKLVEPKDKK